MRRPKCVSVPHDGVFIGCMDDGFRPHYEAILEEEFGMKNFFPITDAGGAGVLAALDKNNRGENAIYSIKLALRKGARRIIASTHTCGCAGYADGGYEFENPEKEHRFHASEAEKIYRRLLRELRGEFPSVVIIAGYFTAKRNDQKPFFVGL
jgi:hypothetical protein